MRVFTIKNSKIFFYLTKATSFDECGECPERVGEIVYGVKLLYHNTHNFGILSEQHSNGTS